MASVNPPAGAHSRRERARLTRLRILAAAHDLFCQRGYTGTRMTDVAVAAAVAVQTVYFIFHTKSQLLQACYERAVLGEDEPLPPERQPWYVALLQATTGEEALRLFAAGNGAIVQRVAVLDEVIRSATHEPEAAAVRARSEGLRREGYRVVVEHLATRFGLREGLSVPTATDLLLTLGGGGVYRSIVLDYGWPHETFIDWLAQTLAQALLAPRRGKAVSPADR